jgi:DNA-directed DNA polymerase III PolC
MSRFVFLENHSVYSLCEGTIFISELAAYAKSRGSRYLSLCDTNGFYGIVNFIQACGREGLKPVICARLKTTSLDCILVARNMEGYGMISRLISEIHLDGSFNLKDELSNGVLANCFIITRDREVLSLGQENVFAEINVLKKNYREDYLYALQHGIKPVLIYPVYFLKKEDWHIHLLLRAIDKNKKLSSLLPEEIQPDGCYQKSEEEICSEYSFMEDALENTWEIAEASSFEFPVGKTILPRYGVHSFSRLKALCFEGLKKRYERITPEILERLAKELRIIHEKGFADYFLVVHDIVKRSTYTCGRGSAAASLVSYLLFITHVDPIRHNLFFERFLNEARPDPPDIDVDFPWDSRDEVLDYIFKKYSPANSAMVSNHITFSVRSSLREVAKVYGVPEKEINLITKNIGYYYNRNTDDFENYSIDTHPSPSMRKIIHDAVDINGRPRYLSVHCGGVVITPKPVSTYIPVEKAPKGVYVIQLEKDQAEDFGFVKIDILGNRSLAVVRDTLNLVNEHDGQNLRYEALNPLDDEPTIRMLAEGNTIGIFYVESPAMRQLQKKTSRGDYEHLVIHSSIIRPAANMYIKEYVERLHGKPYRPLLPEMGEILDETYGIMCYQEDITKIALRIADFSLAEACELRKVVSNRRKAARKLELKDQFYRNLRKKHIGEQIIDRIWHMIESFSGYSFCKPHSASYALLSFKACYLKAHYPAEFMGAVLKNQGGYYCPLAYISEARRLGLKVEPPDINLSRNEYFGRKDTVYIGFMQIKSLTKVAVRLLLTERKKHGPYTGLIDFMKRTGASLTDTVLLIKAGCFRNIEPYNQPQLLYMAHVFQQGKEKKEEETLKDLLQCEQHITPPPIRDIPPEQKIKNEIDLYGFIVTMHPMRYWRERITDPDVILAKDLGKWVGKKVRVSGILITAKTVPTRDDELMQFISFEDETDIFETIFFPKVYKKHALRLSYQRPYILCGRVEEEFGVISLNVYDIELV